MKTKKKVVKTRGVKTTTKKSLRDKHTMMVPIPLDLSTYVVLVYILGWNSSNYMFDYTYKIGELCSKYEGKEHGTSGSILNRNSFICIEHSFKNPRMAYDFYKSVNKLIGKKGWVTFHGLD